MDRHHVKRHRSHGKPYKDGQRHHHKPLEDGEHEFSMPEYQHHQGLRKDYSRSPSRTKVRDSRIEIVSEAKQDPGLVENWLANVSRKGVISPEYRDGQYRAPDPSVSRGPEWRPHDLDLPDDFRRGHKRNRSRDSSIIAAPVTDVDREPPVPARYYQQESERQPGANVPKSNGSVISTGTPSPRFEKRQRHKTREDRYDSRKQSRKRKTKIDEGKPKQLAPPKKTISSGQEVMENFHSEAILQNRLTLQPSLTSGLFQNGRVSSPKHVEELAYNSMPPQHLPPRLSSRQQHQQSQIKEKQRREREAEEMLDFFCRKETPENEVREESQRQLHVSRPVYRLGAQLGLEDYHKWLEVKQGSGGSPEVEVGQTSRRNCQSRSTAGARSALPPRSSSRATSYVTWSTSNHEQPSIPRETGHRHHSITPDPVKEALRDTGVFDGTGILGKDRTSESGSLCAESHSRMRDSSGRGTPGNEARTSAVSFQRPVIIRYEDKAVMTTDELQPFSQEPHKMGTSHEPENGGCVSRNDEQCSPKVDVADKNLSVPTIADIEKVTQEESNVAFRQPTDDATTRAQIATQAYLGSKEISTQTSPTTNSENQSRAPRDDEPIQSHGENLGRTSANSTRGSRPSKEVRSAIEDNRAPVAEPRVGPRGKPTTSMSTQPQIFSFNMGNPSPRFGNTSVQSNIADHPPAPRDEDVVVNINDSARRIYLETDSGGEETRPYAVPQFLSQVHRQQEPYCDTNIPGYRTQHVETFQLEPSESLVDFIARVEKEVLGGGREELARAPVDESVDLQRTEEYAETPNENYGWEHAPISDAASACQQLEEASWQYSENARPNENAAQLHQSYPAGQAYNNEQDEMYEFWRPNYLY